MDDTKLFARDCAVFFKKRLFTPNVSPSDLALHIDAAVAVIAQNMLGDGPHLPSIADMVMGTKGPGSPHQGQLVAYLKSRNLSAEFFEDIPR
jgi:hypothetical protein